MTFLHVSGLNVASIEADTTRSTASQLVRLDCSPWSTTFLLCFIMTSPKASTCSAHGLPLRTVPFSTELFLSHVTDFSCKNWWILTFVKSHNWYFKDPKYHWWVSPKWSLYPMSPHFEPMNPGLSTNLFSSIGLIGDVVKVQTVAENPGEANDGLTYGIMGI